MLMNCSSQMHCEFTIPMAYVLQILYTMRCYVYWFKSVYGRLYRDVNFNIEHTGQWTDAIMQGRWPEIDLHYRETGLK